MPSVSKDGSLAYLQLPLDQKNTCISIILFDHYVDSNMPAEGTTSELFDIVKRSSFAGKILIRTLGSMVHGRYSSKSQKGAKFQYVFSK